jgi:hypothetical protein
MALTCLQQPGAGDGDDGVCGPRPMIDHQCD